MDTPVLLIAFNRPEQTKLVVDALILVGATRVYAAVDGPRPNNPEDASLVQEVQRIIDESPWPGTITTLFRDNNLGCREGVSSAISWLFSGETRGIILEDDCVPDQSFFPFATEMLERYESDERMGMISGSTFFPLAGSAHLSYTFTRYPHIWGWATWKRAWDHYDTGLDTWHDASSPATLEEASGGSSAFVKFWTRLLDGVASGEIDTWDYIWSYSFWRAGFLSVSPGKNLITNIGFSPNATHTKRYPLGKAFRPEASRLPFPLLHPQVISPNIRLDHLTRELAMGVRGQRIRSVLRIGWIIRQWFMGGKGLPPT